MSFRLLIHHVCALLLAASCVACEDAKVIPRSEVVVSVDSDLSAGSELTRVEVRLLELAGSTVLKSHEFVLADGKRDGVELPFELTITQGKQDRFRLQVIGYRPKDAEGDEESVAYEVIGEFRPQQRLALHVLLAEACSGVSCTGEKTCYPLAADGIAAGACGPIREETRLPLHPAAAPAWRDATVDGDGSDDQDARADEDAGAPDGGASCDSADACLAGCGSSNAAECKDDPGATCEDGSTCKSGHCVDGVCCLSACEGDCDACNLPGKEGTCSELDYTSDATNCGECGVVCSDQNVLEPMCRAGECGGECASGYDDCVDGNNGCETYVVDNPEKCGSCGNPCDYPYCHNGRCPTAFGSSSLSGGENFPAQVLYGFPIDVPESGTLVALGLLTRTPALEPKPLVRIGLYVDEGDFLPGVLVAQTGEIEAVDSRTEQGLLVGTQGAVEPIWVQAGSYFVFFSASAALEIYVEDRTTDNAWETTNHGFDTFSEYPNFDENTSFPVTKSAVDAYLLVVPDT